MSFDENTKSLAVGLENGGVNLFKKENGVYSKTNQYRKKHGQRISAIKFEKHIDDNNNDNQKKVLFTKENPTIPL